MTWRTDNRVGWVLLAAGLGMGLALLGQLWAYLSLASFGSTLPLTVAGALVGAFFSPALFLVMLIPLLLPDGRLLSRRWAGVAGLLLASATATLAGTLLRPGPIEGMDAIDNPLGQPALAELAKTLVDLGGNGALVCLPAGILAAILRYRRGSAVERRQLKWVGSTLVLAFSLFLGAAALPQPYGQASWIARSLSMGLIPVAIGIAILRYRLYEIDRIVSRTIAYGLLTALLAVVFVGSNLSLQALVSGLTGGGTLSVAASTLLVAALFQPVRRAIQRVIDRRFNRAGSDAEQVIGAFAARTRDQVDLVELRRSITSATAAAVQPAGSALWLRGAGAGSEPRHG